MRGVRDDCVDGDDIFDTGGAPENIVTTVTIVTLKWFLQLKSNGSAVMVT